MMGIIHMITRSKTWAGFQCPACGRIQLQELSAFAFSGSERKQILCEYCHQPFAAVTSPDRGHCQIQAVCLDCYSAHVFKVKRGAFWLESLREFNCPQTDELILAVGERERVENLLEEQFYMDEHDLEEAEDFLQSQSRDPAEAAAVAQFVAVIEHFKQLGARGKLACACSHPQIQLKVEDHWLEFVCIHCGRMKRLDISDPEKMLEAQQIETLRLSGKPKYEK